MSEIFISTDRSKLDLPLITDFLTTSYWARGRTLEEVKLSVENSLCFGVYLEDQQIGLARVVSDRVVFAYIMDVFLLEPYRGRGYAKMLMREIINHPSLKNAQNWYLITKDAQDFYRPFGFKPFEGRNRTVMFATQQDLRNV